jgi:hypothetical protein
VQHVNLAAMIYFRMVTSITLLYGIVPFAPPYLFIVRSFYKQNLIITFYYIKITYTGHMIKKKGYPKLEASPFATCNFISSFFGKQRPNMDKYFSFFPYNCHVEGKSGRLTTRKHLVHLFTLLDLSNPIQKLV